MAALAAPEPARVTITKTDAQTLLIYLSTRPYKEVFQLVPILVNAPAVVKPEPEKATKKRSRKSKESKK